jgi:hypothetical protein
MRSPEWKAMSDEDRRSFVKDTLEDFRATARAELLERHLELTRQQQPPEAAAAVPALGLVNAAKNASRGGDPWAEFKPAH